LLSIKEKTGTRAKNKNKISVYRFSDTTNKAGTMLERKTHRANLLILKPTPQIPHALDVFQTTAKQGALLLSCCSAAEQHRKQE